MIHLYSAFYKQSYCIQLFTHIPNIYTYNIQTNIYTYTPYVIVHTLKYTHNIYTYYTHYIYNICYRGDDGGPVNWPAQVLCLIQP